MNNLIQIQSRSALAMSSREIAVLTGSTHDNVLKTVRHLIDRGIVFGNEAPYIHEQNRQEYVEFLLSFRDTMVVVSGYSAELRAKIIDRWQELERQTAPALPQTFHEALRLAADLHEQKAKAEAALAIAVATKAEIGSRREATAMQTASVAVKKAQGLEVQLDQSMQYATIKRMEMIYHGQKFNWRLLKSAAIEMNLPAIDVFDQNYGKVNGYHADVWREAYALSIEGEA